MVSHALSTRCNPFHTAFVILRNPLILCLPVFALSVFFFTQRACLPFLLSHTHIPMKAPLLAPRPSGRPVVATATATGNAPHLQPERQLSLTHSDAEWTAAYSEIERLYVRERRKLRHVMQSMEREHNFSATHVRPPPPFYLFMANRVASKCTRSGSPNGASKRTPSGKRRPWSVARRLEGMPTTPA